MKYNTGDRVIYSDNKTLYQDKIGVWYPPVGTMGTVVRSGNHDCLVTWDSGTREGSWWVSDECLTPAEELSKPHEFDAEIDELLGSISKNNLAQIRKFLEE